MSKLTTFKTNVNFQENRLCSKDRPLLRPSMRSVMNDCHRPWTHDKVKTYWSSQNVHLEFKGTPFWLEFTRPLEGLRAVVGCLIVTVRFDRGANPGGWLMGAFSVLWLVNRCSFSGRLSMDGRGFGRVKKFSLLSVSFRSVLDRKIVIFGLIQAVTLVPLPCNGIQLPSIKSCKKHPDFILFSPQTTRILPQFRFHPNLLKLHLKPPVFHLNPVLTLIRLFHPHPDFTLTHSALHPDLPKFHPYGLHFYTYPFLVLTPAALSMWAPYAVKIWNFKNRYFTLSWISPKPNFTPSEFHPSPPVPISLPP